MTQLVLKMNNEQVHEALADFVRNRVRSSHAVARTVLRVTSMGRTATFEAEVTIVPAEPPAPASSPASPGGR